MNVSLEMGPTNTVAKLEFLSGEAWTTEAGAMIAMSSGLQIETSTHKKGKGGVLKGLKRMFAGESFFMNHYTAQSEATLWLAPSMPGDITLHELQGDRIVVQAGSFLACDSGVDISTGWQGFKNILSGESLFWINLSGTGPVLFSAYGAIYTIDVDGSYIVDTGHIVAFEESLNFNLSKAGSSWLHSVMGGEGIVCRFQGKGKVWCQSHNLSAFGWSLRPHLRAKKR
ncbi:TIGR00266 family protein [Pseudobacteriovorax antillogorgiicola]|uniref:TIGR00266 family protein n=1 Tax=Pseudobacteriovorax antillogorgiicola TaxID=1513793 RepID=A0A1Y6C7T1_9BACT|nr:TIGR00266 family protein [Pseudobacteriovorax antillogorgiicola]TCS50744.1 uncharacterized protein (TIGR00266 family) [Pseudobacteriovorax antillogorgiicola]SMF41044.1 TIGR00266 family protein [Pseudobacteriovorax antillogorgiicola]